MRPYDILDTRGARRTIQPPAPLIADHTPSDKEIAMVVAVLNRLRCAEPDGISKQARGLADLLNDIVSPKATDVEPGTLIGGLCGCKAPEAQPNRIAELFDAMLCYYKGACEKMQPEPTTPEATVEERLAALETGLADVLAQLLVITGAGDPNVNNSSDPNA
jgi:hypothetical protein